MQTQLAGRSWWSRLANASSRAPGHARQQVSSFHHLSGASCGVWGPIPQSGTQVTPTKISAARSTASKAGLCSVLQKWSVAC